MGNKTITLSDYTFQDVHHTGIGLIYYEDGNDSFYQAIAIYFIEHENFENGFPVIFPLGIFSQIKSEAIQMAYEHCMSLSNRVSQEVVVTDEEGNRLEIVDINQCLGLDADIWQKQNAPSTQTIQ